jgi:hypothetical protein
VQRATTSTIPPLASQLPPVRFPRGGSNSANYTLPVGDLTNGGAYTGTKSPYGVFDMDGNVWERNEALFDGSSRGLRGSSFDDFDSKTNAPGAGTATLRRASTSLSAFVWQVLLSLSQIRFCYSVCRWLLQHCRRSIGQCDELTGVDR